MSSATQWNDFYLRQLDLCKSSNIERNVSITPKYMEPEKKVTKYSFALKLWHSDYTNA